MKPNKFSTCFCTKDVELCRDFYTQYFSAKVVFDCGWYAIVKIDQLGSEICFIQPQEGMAEFEGYGVMLNFSVDDVDAEYARLSQAGLDIPLAPEDHPWGDRGFSVIDPIGNMVYLYTDIEPSDEFKAFFVSE